MKSGADIVGDATILAIERAVEEVVVREQLCQLVCLQVSELSLAILHSYLSACVWVQVV